MSHACAGDDNPRPLAIFAPIRSRNDVLYYLRLLGEEQLLIGLNSSHEPRQWEWQGRGCRLMSTNLDKAQEPIGGQVQLRSDEGLIVKLEQSRT
jgi:alpha-glucosidase